VERNALLPEHQGNETETQRSALYSPNPEFIRYAVRYLGTTRDTQSYARIHLIAQTSYSPPDLVRDALDALCLIHTSDALETILDAARRHRSHLVREHAVMLLANYAPSEKLEPTTTKYREKSLFEAVRERLSDESWGVRRNACEVMGRWGDPLALVPLRGATSDSVDDVSLAAHESLSRIRERLAKPEGGSALQQEEADQSST
jgi:HEAT repeat protein